MRNTPDSFLYIILKNRKFILKAMLLIMAVTVGVTFLLPRKYTVKTVILPPEEPASPGLSIGGLSVGEFAGFFSGGMGYSLPLMTTLSDVYAKILNSRTLMDNVIISTGYADTVGINEKHPDNPEVALFLARRHFNKNYSATVGSSGFIEIEVTTGDPYYSVDVSERVVFLLDSINTDITMTRYLENRQITENQLLVSRAALERTTASLIGFEEEYGSIMPEEEIIELMGVMAEMKGRYIETTLMANAIRNGIRYGTTAQILELETEARALSQAITMIETGSDEYSDINMGLGIRDLPPAVIEYARLRTDFEMYLKMTSALELQVEQALVQEANIKSSIRLLDPPRHPGWKSKPKKLFIWIEVFLAASVILGFFIFSREKMVALKEEKPEVWAKWDDMFREIRGDFKRKK